MQKNILLSLVALLFIVGSPSCVKIHKCSCHIEDSTLGNGTTDVWDDESEIPGTKKFATTECERKGERYRELYDETSSCQLK